MYRTIANHSYSFSEKLMPSFYQMPKEFDMIHDSLELEKSLKKSIEETCKAHKAAIALSGGIDSAILAKFMPKGSVAYTFKCVVPGIDVLDETPIAAAYAAECGLDHKVVEVYWEDFEKYSTELMKHKGTPIHSIEVQIYKASLIAKKEGHDMFIFGESSDLNYGGLSGLLSRDWTIGEFVDRYAYVKPYYALKDSVIVTQPITDCNKDGFVDVHKFDTGFFFVEAMGSYTNACSTAEIGLSTPYAKTRLATPLDLKRIRSGENKYLVRELFQRLYPGFPIPPKTPMPRPMDEWLANWEGPVRSEFWEHCTNGLSGDQKWLIWCLEHFFNVLDEI